MEDPRTEQARHYLANLQSGEGVPDELYLALLDHADTLEAKAASTILAFHRDIGNGGLAQALSNKRGDVAAILDGLKGLGPQAETARGVVAEAAALYQSLPEEPDQAGDAWDHYNATYDAAEEQWEALDRRYLAATNPVVPGDDLLEKAVLAYALANAAAFTTPAAAAEAEAAG